MKKNIIFVINSMNIGGAEKSLVTLLNMINYEKYNVDLFLFGVEGEYLKQVPQQVNILTVNEDYKYFKKNRVKSIFHFAKQLKFEKSLAALTFCVGYIFYKIAWPKKHFTGWRCSRHILANVNNEYDTSIGFIERTPLYFSVHKIQAKNHIGFIHNDYSKYPFSYRLDKCAFQKCSKIATVSEHCKEVLCEIFPEYSEKFTVIKNIIDEASIKQMAMQGDDEAEKSMKKTSKDAINIVTVARLEKQKGIDKAIKICKKLNEKGYEINWNVIGQGSEFSNLKEMIKENGLENSFFLRGSRANPYVWMNKCDIYVQPSRFEGYGITVAEAKCLKKVIVASSIPEFKEQIIDGKTGFLAEGIDDFVEKIINLKENDELNFEIQENLKMDKSCNLNELEKIYEIIEN